MLKIIVILSFLLVFLNYFSLQLLAFISYYINGTILVVDSLDIFSVVFTGIWYSLPSTLVTFIMFLVSSKLFLYFLNKGG